MKKKILFVLFVSTSCFVTAQNVGIGTSAPLQKLHVEGTTFLNGNVGIGISTVPFPLSFSQVLGDKISLWSNSTTSYGFGIQSGLLQIHTDGAFSDIAFGHGSSNSMMERMRIINNNTGFDGMILNGRLVLKNGSTDFINGGGGVWLYKPDNTALLGFMGAQNNQNIGFYGGPAGWGFTYDAINSRVGIGNVSPNAPLSFPAVLGKKITLYPGATGDVGFGVSGNRLQIYSDNPSADVAIGYDAGGTFNERFAVKPNGALAINGNTGQPGQALVNNASGVPQWTSLTTTYSPGQFTLGGVVFWVDETGQHGLVASTIDQDILSGGPGVKWWPNSAFIFTNRVRKDGIYIGQLNTDSILARHDPNTGDIAAAQCARWLGSSNETHYGDWYLPSLTELQLLQTQRALVEFWGFPFTSALYWSSTEVSSGEAYAVHFGTGSSSIQSKSNVIRVRAIRRF